MTRNASLDILIPHYNDVQGLALSLQSIVSQTWSGSKRVVVADDGSTPESLAQVRRLLETLSLRSTLLEGKANRGRPYTRNVLLDAMESPFAAWLDAGDEWYPTKLSAQFDAINALTTEDARQPFWVTCDYDWKWTGAKARRVAQVVDQDQIRALLTGKNLRAYLWTLLAPSEHFRSAGRFDEKLLRLQDVDFFLNFLTAGERSYLQGVECPCASIISPTWDETRGRYANATPICSRNIANCIVAMDADLFVTGAQTWNSYLPVLL